MRLSELIDRRCVDETGRELGHVFELRAHRRGDRLVIGALLLGRSALLERYGAGHHRPSRGRDEPRVREVPWRDVVRVEDGRIIVREQS
jgi:sporulation protein YlmC with PRC-barrel domain